jgi:hypothetical protein
VLSDHLLGDVPYLFADGWGDISQGMAVVKGEKILFA